MLRNEKMWGWKVQEADLFEYVISSEVERSNGLIMEQVDFSNVNSCGDTPPIPLEEAPRGITWVEPELKCEVTFQEETPRGHFRAPAFKRLVS